MRILITGSGRYLAESADSPEVGKSYDLEDAGSGTAAQGRLFHSLLDAFWNWMHDTNTFQIEADGIGYDFTTPDVKVFKKEFKKRYGAGFEYARYSDEQHRLVDVLPVWEDVYKKVNGKLEKQKTLKDIPESVMLNIADGNKERIEGVLKSWADYTKKERSRAIETLLTIIKNSGCNSKKIKAIMDGLEQSLKKKGKSDK